MTKSVNVCHYATEAFLKSIFHKSYAYTSLTLEQLNSILMIKAKSFGLCDGFLKLCNGQNSTAEYLPFDMFLG